MLTVGRLKPFQSTPSVGRATVTCRRVSRQACISIHALRGEGDAVIPLGETYCAISIHALRGEGDRDRLV